MIGELKSNCERALKRGHPPDVAVERLSDEALLAETVRAAAEARRATAYLVALLIEVDTRQLYLGQG